MKKNYSKKMRKDYLFMRNTFNTYGQWDIPVVTKQDLNQSSINLIAWSETKSNDSRQNRKKGVHFFIDDYRFNGVYNNPEKSLNKLSQYAFLLTPDFSTYAEMDIWRQLQSVAHNRWCGAYWQSQGLIVYPTVSWSTPSSFSFCFDGIEKHATVAIGMIGCKRHNKLAFMRGYDAMLEKLEPENIICYGQPFKEMVGNLIVIDYFRSQKAVS